MTRTTIVPDQRFRSLPITRWTLPTRFEPFMQFLDRSGLGDDDESAVAEFMRLPVAELMPGPLRDELRRAGLLVEV